MEVKRQTADGQVAIFDSDSKKFIRLEQSKPGMIKRGWNALGVPEKMSRQGLGQMASMIPPGKVTGNLPADLARGTPRIAADTIAQVAPGFVSRGSLLTMGALKGGQEALPFLGKMGEGLASQLESSSGAAPGSLKAAYGDASLIGSKGTEEARPLYQAAEQELKGSNVWRGKVGPGGTLEMEQGGQNAFRSMPENVRIVRRARQMLDSGQQLEPAEALTARKAADALKNSRAYSKDFLINIRRELDAVAKSSENIAEADPLHARGVMGKSLRNLLPQNKFGGASAFKMGIAPALTGLGGFVGGPEGAALGAGAAGMALSPAVQGAAATGAGLVGRNAIEPLLQNPKIGSLIVAALKSLRKKNPDENPNP